MRSRALGVRLLWGCLLSCLSFGYVSKPSYVKYASVLLKYRQIVTHNEERLEQKAASLSCGLRYFTDVCLSKAAMRLRGGKGRVPGKGFRKMRGEQKYGFLNSRANSHAYEDSAHEDWSSSSDDESADRQEKAPLVRNRARKRKSRSDGSVRSTNQNSENGARPPKSPQSGVQLLGKEGANPLGSSFDWEAYGQQYEQDELMDVVQISDSDEDLGPGRAPPTRRKDRKKFQRERERLATNAATAETDGKPDDDKGKRSKTKTKKKQRKSKSSTQGGGNEVDTPGFGMEQADLADGEAFNDFVGTKGAKENRFYIPAAALRDLRRVGAGDPLDGLDRSEDAAHRARAADLEARAARRAEAAERRRLAAMRPGVLFVGHIPYGFYEEAQYQFFSQYGTVTRLRLARSRRTSGYKGYGYVEFADSAVAARVAKEMDGYILDDKALRCRLLEWVHPDTFRNCHRKFVKVNWADVAARRQIRRAKAAEAAAAASPEAARRAAARERRKARRYEQTLARVGLLKAGFELETSNLPSLSPTDSPPDPPAAPPPATVEPAAAG